MLSNERREIIFDEWIIDTGVPRGEGPSPQPPVAAPREPAPQPEAPAAPQPVRSETAVADTPSRPVRTQIEQPTKASPGGRIAEGWFKVEGGILHVEDMQGRLLGRQPVSPGDDVEVVARKLLREKNGKHLSFHGPIKYPPASYH
jgi:hypothetical protein